MFDKVAVRSEGASSKAHPSAGSSRNRLPGVVNLVSSEKKTRDKLREKNLDEWTDNATLLF